MKVLTVSGPSITFKIDPNKKENALDQHPKYREVYNKMSDLRTEIDLIFNDMKDCNVLKISGVSYHIQEQHRKFPKDTCNWCAKDFERDKE